MAAPAGMSVDIGSQSLLLPAGAGARSPAPEATAPHPPTSKSESRSTRIRGCSKGSSLASRATAVEPNLRSRHVHMHVRFVLDPVLYYDLEDATKRKLCCHSLPLPGPLHAVM